MGSVNTDGPRRRQSDGLDHPAAEHPITMVEHGGLTGAQGSLRRTKGEEQPVVVDGFNRRCGCRCGIPNLHGNIRLAGTQTTIKEIELLYMTCGTEQGLFGTEDDGIGQRHNLLHVETLTGRNAESASLARRVKSDPVVASQIAPIVIDEIARASCLRHFRFDEGAIITIAHKANLLAFL